MKIIHRATIRSSHRGSVGKAYFWLFLVVCTGWGYTRAADSKPADPNNTAAQAELIARVTAESVADKTEAVLWAQQYGYPIRSEDNQRVYELMAVWKDRPVYFVADNVNAAISTAADRIRDMVAWNLDGSGVNVGLWDESVARATHREFRTPDGKSRLQAGDRGGSSPHTTHVAGTIGAMGIDPAAKGMAPAAAIQSFNWNYDASKMAVWTAYAPGQSNAIYVSNHSYGFIGGWVYLSTADLTGYKGWHWTATWLGAGSYDDWFGAYHKIAQQWDDVAYTKNYYLAFAAAGNDRTDNPPLGETVYYSKSNLWYSTVYDLGTCPLGDGFAKGGYDTICGPAVAKNIVTVGAVGDAVADGARSLADANMATFSSWGPTTDGRIKPDIVANGVNLYSTDSNSDDSYATHSGTSMATPNATGSAALLVQFYHRLFPGKSMRASTLKGLIIQTADDLGRPGPDYQFGWGLMNARAAAELIQRQHDEPAGRMMLEGRLTSNNPVDNNPDDVYYFYSDAVEPIRISLCWTDPPGVYTTNFSDTSPRLIHDLDMRVVEPDGSSVCYPYVLNPADPCAVATTGDNRVDPVEQVYIGAPSEVGRYKVQINYKGTLAKGEQYYSLVSNAPLFDQSPPAADMSVFTALNTAVTITLKATDDGLPKPPARLTYTIASLPQHGSLKYPTGTTITTPGKIINSGNQVVYTPNAGYTGDDSFRFYTDDGGTAPAGGPSNTATVALQVTNLVTAHYQINAPADDGYASIWGGYQMLSSASLLVGQYTTGMRFTNVAIPQGSQIVSACLEVCQGSDHIDKRFASVLRAEATGNAISFAKAGRYINDLPRTQASVSWVWDTSTRYSKDASGDGQPYPGYWFTSPDISGIVQEIVARADWSQGNAIALLYASDGASTWNLSLLSYEQYPARSPGLTVAYIPPAGAGTVTPPEPGQAPPVATNMTMYVTANMPGLITLGAADDGLPGPTGFTISSLPGHGSLQSLSGTPITKPATLTDLDGQVVYKPSQGFSGDDSFTFYADDGGSAPAGGKSNTATVTLKVRYMITREYEVIAQEDDAYGTDANTVVVSETLSVGQHSSAMRFRNIDIPQDSEIVRARLKLCMDTTSIDKPVEGTLYAQAVGDANDFNQPDLRIPTLPRTQASVPWTWTTGQTCPREQYCSSPELRTVVQEIIDRDDWSAGNCMAILCAGGASSGQDLKFFACSTPYSNCAAALEITYTLKPGVEWIAKGIPPQAGNPTVSTTTDKPITITLGAVDDGLPNPPGKLTYMIVSLPSHGTLEYPAGGQIAAPGTLPDFGNQVVYRAEPNFAGDDSFTFYADDGGTRPRGGKSDTGTVKVTVTGPVIQTITRTFETGASVDDASATSQSTQNAVFDTYLKVGVTTSAVRFKGLDIPRASKIVKAQLTLNIIKSFSTTSPVEGLIQAEATGNAAGFMGDDRYLLQLPRTKASVAWIWEGGLTYGAPFYRPRPATSPDLAAVVQEIVNRPDWVPGNAIALILSSTNQPGTDLEFVAYDLLVGNEYDPHEPPSIRNPSKLEITYAQ
jgi:hypothetical protein